MASWRWLAPGFRRVFARDLARLSARVAVSEAARADLMPFVPGDYRVIPNGVDTERFSPGTAPSRQLPNGRTSLLYVGRLDRRKGLPVLLRAFSLLQARFRDLHLSVVGTGPLLHHCRRMAAKLRPSEAVSFEGYVSAQDLPSRYAAVDLCCFPTLGGEAFGIVLLEAMASGKPVVTTDIAGYREVIRNRIDGLLAKPSDPNDLARAIAEVLGNDALRKNLALAGLDRAQRFSWPRVTDQIEALYREVTG